MDLKNAVAERKAESRVAFLSARTKARIADMNRMLADGKADPKAVKTETALLTGELSKKDYVDSIRKKNEEDRKRTAVGNAGITRERGVQTARDRVTEMNKTFFSERPEKLVFDEKRDVILFVNRKEETPILSAVSLMAGKAGISENVIRAELKKLKVEV